MATDITDIQDETLSLELSRKRQRVTDVADTPASTRDEKYYIESGDCVILVESVLFRVHRFIISRDSSAFQNMFTMPPNDGSVLEGSSDENPIFLQDSADNFRALMWVLYALPPEIEVCNSKNADLDQLVRVAEITNKYHFGSLESWAIEALYKVISGQYGDPIQPLKTSDRLARVLEASILCGHDPLRDLVSDQWTASIITRELDAAPALLIADKYNLRMLLGCAYYMQLMMVGTSFSKEDGLSRDQRIRIISGHLSLVNLWERLRSTPPKFEKGGNGCVYHQNGCVSTWTKTWCEVGKSENTLMFGSADVIGKLRCMEEQLSWNPELTSALTPACRSAALQAVTAVIKEVEETLADHFNDVTEVD